MKKEFLEQNPLLHIIQGNVKPLNKPLYSMRDEGNADYLIILNDYCMD